MAGRGLLERAIKLLAVMSKASTRESRRVSKKLLETGPMKYVWSAFSFQNRILGGVPCGIEVGSNLCVVNM